jgi:outer membrane protein
MRGFKIGFIIAVMLTEVIGLSPSVCRGTEAAQARDMTLKQAIDIALDQNPDVIMALLNEQKINSQYWETFSLALPHVTLTGSYTNNVQEPVFFANGQKVQAGEQHSANAMAILEQALFTGGKVGTAIKVADHLKLIATLTTRATKDNVAFGVKNLYYTGLLAQALSAIQEDNLNSADDHLKTMKKRYSQGLDSDLTVRRQEVEVANAKTLLIQARNFYEMTVTSLQEVLALDVDKPIRLMGNLKSPAGGLSEYEFYVQKALDRRPELKIVRERKAVAKNLIAIARGDMYPEISGFGHYRWISESKNWPPDDNERATNMAFGLQARYRFFTGGETWQRIRQAQIEYERSNEEEKRIERAVRVEIKKEWLNVMEALERLRAQEAAVDQARLALKSTEIRYRQGEANQLELNDATFALNRVRTFYSTAARDLWVGLAGLERAAGIEPEEVKK